MDLEQFEVLSKGEELLARARAVARRIEKRARKLMPNHGLAARHSQDGTAVTAAAERSQVRPADTPLAP
jgi:hypothetical protein